MKNVEVHFYGEIHTTGKNGRYEYCSVDVDSDSFKGLLKTAKICVESNFQTELKNGKKFFVRNIERQLVSVLPTYRLL